MASPPPLVAATKSEVEDLIRTWLKQHPPNAQPTEAEVITYLETQGFEIIDPADLSSAINNSWTAHDTEVKRAKATKADSDFKHFKDVILYKLNVDQRTKLFDLMKKSKKYT
jgi:hypothetical protein